MQCELASLTADDAAEDTLRLTVFEDVRLHWCSACESSHDHVASDEIWDALLSHRVLRRWKWLECSRREVDARRLRALVESPHLCRLEKLWLSSPVGLEGLSAIASARNEAAAMLARSSVLELTSFGSPAPSGERGIEALTGAPLLRRVEVVGLIVKDGVRGALVTDLLQAIQAPLHTLAIEGRLVGFDTALADLASTDVLRHAARLELEGFGISDEGLTHLLAPCHRGASAIGTHHLPCGEVRAGHMSEVRPSRVRPASNLAGLRRARILPGRQLCTWRGSHRCGPDAGPSAPVPKRGAVGDGWGLAAGMAGLARLPCAGQPLSSAEPRGDRTPPDPPRPPGALPGWPTRPRRRASSFRGTRAPRVSRLRRPDPRLPSRPL